MALYTLFFTLGLLVSMTLGAVSTGVYLMPMNCAELVPDMGPFLGFFENVAKGMASSQKGLSKRMFRVLGLRERLASETGRVGEGNPVDPLVRKFLCFYREQKDPLRVIGYDDAEFMGFIKNEFGNLEKQVDDAIFRLAYENQKQKEYERKLETQKYLIESIKDEANREADQFFDKAALSAKNRTNLK